MRRIALASGAAAIALAGTAGSVLAVALAHSGPATPTTTNAALIDGEDTITTDHPADPTSLTRQATTNNTAGTGGSSGGGAAGGGAGSSGGSSASGSSASGSAGGGSAGGGTSGGSGGSGSAGGCDEGRWPAVVQGAPADFAGGVRAGDYLWHDGYGFHLRVTHRGDRRDVFTGTIHADAPMALLPVRLEGRDAVALSADRRTISFRFYDYGHIDGVNFVTRCATALTVQGLTADRYALPAGRVYLGSTKAHPAGVPFTLTRPASRQ